MREKESLEPRKAIVLRPFKSDLDAFTRKCEGRPRTRVIRRLMEMYVSGEITITRW